MESPSPTPSQPPAREIQIVRISSSPPQRRSSRPPAGRGATREMRAMVEEIRSPPIPQSRREMELGTIRKIAAKLEPNLSKEEKEKLEAAADAADKVAGISPKTEFIARLENGLFHKVLEAYAEIGK